MPILIILFAALVSVAEQKQARMNCAESKDKKRCEALVKAIAGKHHSAIFEARDPSKAENSFEICEIDPKNKICRKNEKKNDRK